MCYHGPQLFFISGILSSLSVVLRETAYYSGPRAKKTGEKHLKRVMVVILLSLKLFASDTILTNFTSTLYSPNSPMTLSPDGNLYGGLPEILSITRVGFTLGTFPPGLTPVCM